MDWPTYSPDLNPIEYVWDMLGQRIAARQPPPSSLPELLREMVNAGKDWDFDKPLGPTCDVNTVIPVNRASECIWTGSLLTDAYCNSK
ncbi:hypothetical protein TNCV_2762341 [Trichonephila clavipes]|nr:hypothetical protein TNCV_2762341 [Trichonephila clavipes]